MEQLSQKITVFGLVRYSFSLKNTTLGLKKCVSPINGHSMRSYLKAFICILMTAQAFGQSIFIEDYTNNSGNWQIESEGEIVTEIENGAYMISNKSEKQTISFSLPLLIDAQQPFEYEITLSRQDNSGIILTWGNHQQGQGEMLAIYGDTLRLFSVYADSIRFHSNWMKIPSYTPNSTESWKVSRVGQRCAIWLNGKPVIKQSINTDLLIKEGSLGFLVGANTEASIDKLLVKYTPAKIKIAPQSQWIGNKQRLSSQINTKAVEKNPLISHDGKSLFFTRRDTDSDSVMTEDIWQSTRDSLHDPWTSPQKLPSPINNDGSNALLAIAPDNQEIWLSNAYSADGTQIGRGISLSRKIDTAWSMPQKVPILYDENNSPYVNYALSPDRSVLLMAVDRKDGLGSLDLYRSFKRKDGRWGKPAPLNINTEQEEFSPFIAADGKTMYFASTGYAGYGSADIFVSKRLDDTWTNWSEPLNMGDKVNSRGWDAYFTVMASGTEAYMVTDHHIGQAKQSSNSDIFLLTRKEASLKEEASPPDSLFLVESLVLLNGKVLDQTTNQPVAGAGILYELLAQDSSQQRMLAIADERGEYQVLLPKGADYSIQAKAAGYWSNQEYYALSTLSEYKEVAVNIYLTPLKKGAVLPLNNLFFKRASAVLLPKSQPLIQQIAGLLKKNASMKIRVEGHTDALGNAQRLMALSLARAKAIKEALTATGVSESRIAVKGYGGAVPIASNQMEMGRQQNRRVEVVVTDW